MWRSCAKSQSGSASEETDMSGRDKTLPEATERTSPSIATEGRGWVGEQWSAGATCLVDYLWQAERRTDGLISGVVSDKMKMSGERLGETVHQLQHCKGHLFKLDFKTIPEKVWSVLFGLFLEKAVVGGPTCIVARVRPWAKHRMTSSTALFANFNIDPPSP